VEKASDVAWREPCAAVDEADQITIRIFARCSESAQREAAKFRREGLRYAALSISVNDTRSDILKMTGAHDYIAIEPSPSEIEALPGLVLLEFGSPWCGYCLRAKPLIEKALENHANVRHIKIADASRRRLGRSFGIRLWPTLVFLRDGKEIARLVRPPDADSIRQALAEFVLVAETDSQISR
jgi:thioredoxin 1